jgi:hypothetical protein
MFVYIADQSLPFNMPNPYSSVKDQLDALIVNHATVASALPAKVGGFDYCKYTP